MYLHGIDKNKEVGVAKLDENDNAVLRQYVNQFPDCLAMIRMLSSRATLLSYIPVFYVPTAGFMPIGQAVNMNVTYV
jgi:hypothetical protein